MDYTDPGQFPEILQLRQSHRRARINHDMFYILIEIIEDDRNIMIPIRLELRNFLPYRSPDPIRFDGIHLACLTGPNGAGKSSLLDAITYALWGKARAKRDEELVHLGQGDMWVQLDFDQEGHTYRVLRQRSRGKRGAGAVNLFIMQEDGTPTTITEPSMRQTQDKINEILRLDYETFVHSAFLQQGKADSFTTKTPAERKKILSDILGLDQWALYEDAVKYRLKTITNNLTYFEQRIQEIETELARKPGLERDLQAAQQSFAEAESARAAAEARLKEVEHAPGDLRGAQQNKADRESRLRDLQREMGEVEAGIVSKQEQLSRYQDMIDSRDEIEQGYAALQSARDVTQAMSDKLKQLTSLNTERAALEKQIESARSRLEADVKNIQSRIAELAGIVSTDYSAELEAVQDAVFALQEKQIERDRLDDHLSGLREELASVKATLEAVKAEGIAQRERLDKLAEADEKEAVCPLCGQPLTAEHRQQLIEEISVEVEQKREEFRKHSERITTINGQIKEHKKLIDMLDADLEGLSPLVERVGTLQNQVRTAQDAALRLEDEHARLAAVLAELESESYAADARQQLAALDARQTELGYDESSHDDAQEQMKAYLRYEQLHMQLQIALNSLESLQENLKNDQARKDRLGKAILDTQESVAQIDLEIARLVALVQEYHAREAEVQAHRTQERMAHERLVSAQQALKALEDQAEHKANLEQRRDSARQEETLYNELKLAFGKNGVPAMIIETAIPELETTANELLARMTDGRMHLRMNTQREKITGGVAETLDIEIADELGTRSYELYSGGEAFRINFAIRVALSQMLARRAGAHLRTLFIDEGFGTQDDSGRGKLVEAINAIQHEFDLILVITHIDDLRDSFPVHIVVDKTPNGSRVGVR